jgi:hypothetical protein
VKVNLSCDDVATLAYAGILSAFGVRLGIARSTGNRARAGACPVYSPERIRPERPGSVLTLRKAYRFQDEVLPGDSIPRVPTVS